MTAIYRLAALLRVREIKKEEAEKLLGEKLTALRVEQKRQREMQEELERMVLKREQRMREYAEKSMRGQMSASEVTGANLYIERLKEQEDAQKNAIEGQKAVVAQKQTEVDEARQAVLVATQELKALEKHKEKWVAEVKREADVREEETMDEIAQAIHLGKTRDR